MSDLLLDNKERPVSRNPDEYLFSENKERPGCRDPDEWSVVRYQGEARL